MPALFDIVRDVASGYRQHRGAQTAAALAFHTMFSLAPLLIIVVGLAGIFFGQIEAQERVISAIREQASPQLANVIQGLISATVTGRPEAATIIGGGIMIFAATNLFIQMQIALDAVFGYRPEQGRGFAHFIGRYARAVVLVIVLAVIVLLAVGTQAFLAWLVRTEEGPGWLAHTLITLAVLTAGLVAVFRIFAKNFVPWSSLLLGSLITGVFFLVGQRLILLYLSNAAVSSTFGAAGSLVALLLFIFYSMQILLLGAELVRTLADRNAEAAGT